MSRKALMEQHYELIKAHITDPEHSPLAGTAPGATGPDYFHGQGTG